MHYLFNLVYNIQMLNLNWSRQNQNQSYRGEDKEGFTLTYVSHLQSILLFGGSHIKSNEVHLYHLRQQAWITQKTIFPRKMSRKYHTAIYEPSIRALIVFGGQADKSRSLDTLDALFIDDWKWRKLALKNSPPPREYHSMVKLKNGHYLIFGGITLPIATFLNDLWVIKGITDIKSSLTLEILGCQAIEVLTKGNKPPGRHSHSSFCYGEHFYVIGGEQQSYEEKFTIYSLHIAKLFWNKHTFNMTVPQLKGFNLIANPLSQDNQLFLFGGIQLNTKKYNRQIFTLSFKIDEHPKLSHVSRIPNNIDNLWIENCCGLPYQQVCGMSCSVGSGPKMLMSRITIEQKSSELTIEDYLKQIKSEQILSQELIKKQKNLQLLYQQMQKYISILYNSYNDYMGDQRVHGGYDNNDDDEFLEQQSYHIEAEKRKQIEQNMRLKQHYIKIEKASKENQFMMKNAREQLAEINENFQGCMETERDQEL